MGWTRFVVVRMAVFCEIRLHRNVSFIELNVIGLQYSASDDRSRCGVGDLRVPDDNIRAKLK